MTHKDKLIQLLEKTIKDNPDNRFIRNKYIDLKMGFKNWLVTVSVLYEYLDMDSHKQWGSPYNELWSYLVKVDKDLSEKDFS